MTKMTVYVPDNLAQRVQAFGDRINLSQVFQTALRAELRRAHLHQEQADLDARLDA